MSDAPNTPTPPATPTEPDTPVVDEAGLSQLEQELLAQFTARDNGADDGAPPATPQSGGAPTTPTPPAPDAPATPPPAATDEPATPPGAPSSPDPGGEGQGPAPAVAPSEPAPQVTPDDAATPPAAPNLSPWDDYPDPAQAETSAKGLLDWYQARSPEDIATIDQALSGDYVMVPAAQVQELQAAWSDLEAWKAGQAPPAPGAPATPPAQSAPVGYDPAGYEPEGGGDPIMAAQLAEIRAGQAATTQQIAAMQEAQMRARMDEDVARIEAQITGAQSTWMDAHPYLDTGDLEALQRHISSSGTYQQNLAAGMDAGAAVTAALEAAAAVIPRVSSKLVDARVNAGIAAGQQVVADQQANGQRASAIAGAGATPPDLSGMSDDDAMVEEIRRSMFG